MLIEWTDDLNIGIEIIDKQHKKIVDYINQLNIAIRKNNRDQVGRVLRELADYTISHLAFEETLLEKVGYLYLKPHKGLHEMFTKRLEKFQQRHDSGEDVAEQLLNMLSIWLVHHIKQSDMDYVSTMGDELNRIVRNKKNGGWLSRTLMKFFRHPLHSASSG
jgi:hemerythrin